MNQAVSYTQLKEINAYKKKLNWGDVSAIYHMVSTSLGDLESILTSGFDSAFKRVLNKDSWNLALLGRFEDENGNVQAKTKPQLVLNHVYGEMGYELHCYPAANNQRLPATLYKDFNCPFILWNPETDRMLFRINSFVSFAIFTYQSGDDADLLLIKHSFYRVTKLIEILKESFDVIEVKGFNIAEFYQEIDRHNGNVLSEDFLQ